MHASIDSLVFLLTSTCLGKRFHDQARVVAAKAKRIGERDVNVLFAGMVRRVVQIAIRIRIFIVNGRMKNLMVERQRTYNSFNRPGRADRVANH